MKMNGLLCKTDGCKAKAVVRLLCKTHYNHSYNTDVSFTTISPCSIERCVRKVVSRGLCNMHRTRRDKYGDPLFTQTNMGVGNTFDERFWSRVAITANTDDCWEWQSTRTTAGYGYCGHKGLTGAHRVAYFLFNKKIPTLFVLHHCDNPPCCNPKHLYEGTPKDNASDRMRRGRGGVRPNVKLNAVKVKDINRRLRLKQSQKEIALIFGVSETTISFIKTGRIWKDVKI